MNTTMGYATKNQQTNVVQHEKDGSTQPKRNMRSYSRGKCVKFDKNSPFKGIAKKIPININAKNMLKDIHKTYEGYCKISKVVIKEL